MRKRMLQRPTPALVISVLALFVALGGSALAAKKIITTPSQLGSKVVKNGKVAKEDLKGNRLRNDTVKGTQVDESTLGTPLVRNVEVVTAETAQDTTSPKPVTATCPTNKKVIGGGATITGDVATVTTVGLESSIVTADQSRYEARGRAFVAEADAWGVRVRAICADV
jgi:hypothetical protein